MSSYLNKTIVILILFLITGTLTYGDLFKPRIENLDFHAEEPLPLQVGKWQGSNLPYDGRVFDEVLGADSTVFRTYQERESGRSVQLYVAYYENMEKSDLSHPPEVCYSGQGWQIRESGTHEIHLGTAKDRLRISKMMIEKGERQELVLFWYQVGERIYPDRIRQRLALIVNKAWGRNMENIWVRVSTPIDKEAPDETLRTELDFISDLYPFMRRYFFRPNSRNTGL
jgi:EpsI family protein